MNLLPCQQVSGDKLSIVQDRRPGRFLLTGSASVMSLPAIADSLAGRLVPVLENWVFGELLKTANLAPQQWFLSHYRDKDQVEVDFFLESPLCAVIGIEVRAAASVNAADFKGLRRLREQCGTDFLSGIVLYAEPLHCP